MLIRITPFKDSSFHCCPIYEIQLTFVLSQILILHVIILHGSHVIVLTSGGLKGDDDVYDNAGNDDDDDDDDYVVN